MKLELTQAQLEKVLLHVLPRTSLAKKKIVNEYRDVIVVKMRDKGYTLREIGSIVGISYQAVDDIIKK